MLLHILYLIGISVEASSGALAAGRKHMDFFGVIMIAAITALGGGTARDVLIGNYPLSWVGHPEYLLFTTTAAVVTIYLARFISRLSIVFLVLDALGLVTFAIIGTEKGLALSLPFSVCAIMGMCTGIFGGVMRDILCNDVPLVFRKEIYALVALIAATLYMLLKYTSLPGSLTVVITLVSCFLLRLAAIFWHLELPKFNYEGE
ncbi:hypothetical protein AVI51_05450 [Piscirickettsia salmonis]|uniref:Membrane protein n=1 Tax=Piscirickettsia salmonis TaxID=1238 RepID=A0A095BG68_PISSA|nr:trimeric intracellular cation channel family protein [Piscirickettsia salmonis]OAJ34135.1 hypothetical protein A0O36_01649 [Piscirickettsiaceae bacterium NZ-RLO1]RNC78084.1 trimeric intracellular cation channel family protein [Piscirickettsiaceae bacterium NZ-RLO2]AKP74361.1 hypothetical protein PSLF89_2785 [Piscirickettsia salmonis LF-89 = ATCC VR-1361]ALA25530.1 membrane protein [Piscirickettsia salmonis]ALB23309.1 membrane protein [Piscirickettsia salmonis]